MTFGDTAKKLEDACCQLIAARLERVSTRRFAPFRWLRYRLLIRKLYITRKKLYGK